MTFLAQQTTVFSIYCPKCKKDKPDLTYSQARINKTLEFNRELGKYEVTDTMTEKHDKSAVFCGECGEQLDLETDTHNTLVDQMVESEKDE